MTNDAILYDTDEDYMQEATFIVYENDPKHDLVVGAIMRKVLYGAHYMKSWGSFQTKHGDMVTKMVIASCEQVEIEQ